LIFHCGEDFKRPKDQIIRGTTAEEQAAFTFQNIQGHPGGLGSSLEHVIKITTLLRDPRDESSYLKAAANIFSIARRPRRLWGCNSPIPR